MKTFKILPLILILISCSQGFRSKDYSPNDLEILHQRVQLLMQNLVKEMDFDTSNGLTNGATVAAGKLILTNPNNNENQYVDTGVSMKNYAGSTISVWVKTLNANKTQHVFWQGVHDQNGWGCGSNNTLCSELNITLNYQNNVSGTILATFLGYNEQALDPALRPVSYPMIWNQVTNLPQLTGPTLTLDTNWHLIVLSMEQKGLLIELKTYYDGFLIQSGTGTQTDISHWDTNVFLGKSGANGLRSFNGQMKTFMMFNKVLSYDEVFEIYQYQSMQ